MAFESVFAVLGGALILKQHLSEVEVIGCIIMFIAIIFAQLPDNLFKRKITKKEF